LKLLTLFGRNAQRPSTIIRKTWLSEQDGPIVDTDMLLGRCDYFALTKAQIEF
jgi:hypothetical protein